MPKAKSSIQELFKKWIHENDDAEKYTVVDDAIHCLHCNLMLYPSKKGSFYKHLRSKSHNDNKYGSCSTTSGEFNYKLTKAFLLSDIPLNKLENPHLIKFLEEACNKKIPHQSTLRRYYVDKVYTETMNNIKKDIGDNFVYVIIDETMDARGRHIGNFLIGALNGKPTTCYLLAIKEIPDTKYETIVQFIQNCLKNCDLVDTTKILVLITDGVAHMVEAGKRLTKIFPNLIHLTCIAEALNRVAEQVRIENPNVNSLIAVGKKIFLKAPTRVAKFHELQPNIPLPPEPIITRWDTWLEAAKYYAEYFDAIKMVVSSLNPEDSSYISEAMLLLNIPTIKDELRIIRSFTIISDIIKQLETTNLPLKTALEYISKLEARLNDKIPGCDYAKNISNKMMSLLDKNSGYKLLTNINDYLNGFCEIPPIDSDLVNFFHYCPVTSVEVERSFPAYKEILSDRRHGLNMDTLEKLQIVYFENNYSRY